MVLSEAGGLGHRPSCCGGLTRETCRGLPLILSKNWSYSGLHEIIPTATTVSILSATINSSKSAHLIIVIGAAARTCWTVGVRGGRCGGGGRRTYRGQRRGALTAVMTPATALYVVVGIATLVSLAGNLANPQQTTLQIPV